uniref:Uncharacterized protein n=1 Tax=viral metagenome TaxID=1070528 RepID=A0A6M3LJL6_9ZZZZ
MAKLITQDEDGNDVEVEIDYTPEQIEELKTKAEESTAKIDEFTKKIEEKEAELEKLRSKDLNFSKYREKTEEEKKKWEEGLKGDVKEVYDELKVLKEERITEKTKRFDSAKKAVLSSLAGDNEDLKKSIENRAADFVGEAQTEEEMEKRFRQAYVLIKEESPKPNPLYEMKPGGSFGDPTDTPPDFVKTERGKQTYEALFGRPPMTHEEIKKNNPFM